MKSLFARLLLILFVLVPFSLGCAGDQLARAAAKIREGGDKVGAVMEYACEVPVGFIAEGTATLVEGAGDVLGGDEENVEASP